jgi:hypothetical protein
MGNLIFEKIATKAWDTAGNDALSKALSLALNPLLKSLQENYNVQQGQFSSFSDSLSAFIGYIVSQKVHKQPINGREMSTLISTGIVPSVAAMASNNPKGEEIVSNIVYYVNKIADNEAFGAILSQFVSDDITEQIQIATNSIAAINNPSLENSNLIPDSDTEYLDNENTTSEIPMAKEEMTDEEDEDFVNNVFDAAKLDFSSPDAAAESFNNFVKVAGEVAKFSEVQKTKRTQIRANADVAIKKVEAMRDVLKDYLEKSFDERSSIFLKQFEVVDKALATGDNAMLSMGLNAINELAASSPFKELANINSVQQMLTDDSEIDI